MPEYSNTVIYKICNDQDDIIYVGHTTNLFERERAHKKCARENSYKKDLKLYKHIIDNGGWSKFHMVHVINFPCENKREAEAKEQEYIDELRPICNDHNAFGANLERYAANRKEYNETHKEEESKRKKAYREKNLEYVKEKNKQWREANKEYVTEAQKKWYEENRDTYNKKRREFRNEHRDEINAGLRAKNAENREEYNKKHRDYNARNREVINARQRERNAKAERHDCECGGHYMSYNKNLHLRSKKHQNYLNQK